MLLGLALSVSSFLLATLVFIATKSRIHSAQAWKDATAAVYIPCNNPQMFPCLQPLHMSRCLGGRRGAEENDELG